MSEAERTDDLALALRQAIARYAEFLRAFEDLKAQVRTWVSDHQPEFEALRLYLEQFGKLNWKDLDRPLREAELALAEAGWTIPGWMYRKDILELAQQSPPAIDATITARFMSDDGKNLERLRSDLLNAPALAQWHSLIEEAIDSIKAGRHRIAIPAALTILEGFVAGALRSRSVIGRKEKSPISKFTKHKWSDKDINEVFFWESAMPFSTRSSPTATSQEEPGLFNRHWVLHGRSAKEWTLADALRLVNAISTMEHLFEKIGWPKD